MGSRQRRTGNALQSWRGQTIQQNTPQGQLLESKPDSSRLALQRTKQRCPHCSLRRQNCTKHCRCGLRPGDWPSDQHVCDCAAVEQSASKTTNLNTFWTVLDCQFKANLLLEKSFLVNGLILQNCWCGLMCLGHDLFMPNGLRPWTTPPPSPGPPLLCGTAPLRTPSRTSLSPAARLVSSQVGSRLNSASITRAVS